MKNDLRNALEILHQFIAPQQFRCLVDLCKGEEKDFYIAKLIEYAERVTTMPKTYEQDGKGKQAIAYLHYFNGGCDWHITEKDVETKDERGQHQAFGLANLGQGGELGYISIVELLENNVELDLHFTPKTLAELEAVAA